MNFPVCPKCGSPLYFDDVEEAYNDDYAHDERWRVKCLSGGECNFEGRLWLRYNLVGVEWIEDEV